MKDGIQQWNDKYSEVKGTPAFSKYITERHAKINGRWKFVGHGVPSPAQEYQIKKTGGKVYLVNGDQRFVIKDGSTDFMEFFKAETK
jgi:hypothetical protein